MDEIFNTVTRNLYTREFHKLHHLDGRVKTIWHWYGGISHTHHAI